MEIDICNIMRFLLSRSSYNLMDLPVEVSRTGISGVCPESSYELSYYEIDFPSFTDDDIVVFLCLCLCFVS